MKIRSAIYQVKRLFREVNADSRLTNKLVYELISKHAKWLIKRDSDALRIIFKANVFQTVKCMKVIEVTAVDPCCGISAICKVWRTKQKLPEIFEDSLGPIITKITSVDGYSSITLVNANTYKNLKDSPYLKRYSRKDKKYAFFNDGYLYFPEGHFDKVSVTGFFVETLPDTDCGDPCKECGGGCKRYMDNELFVPDYLEAQVIDAVIKDLSNTYKRLPEKSHNINKNDNE